MDLKVGLVIVCLCAWGIIFTEAGIPKCCLATKMNISLAILRKVQRWDIQQSSGACDIPALILHVKDMRRPICAHPKEKRVLMWLRMRMKQNRQKATYRDA